MIIVQTRKIAVNHYRYGGNPEVPWVEVFRRPDFFQARADIMALMQEMGFAPFSEVCLLVDELNPAVWKGDPDKNILTTDDGAQIRTLAESSCETCQRVTDPSSLYEGVARGTVRFGPVRAGVQSYQLACGHIVI